VALQKNTQATTATWFKVAGGKGSNYSLRSEGLATGKEIMSVFERTEVPPLK
jgi:hypothetical protein